MKSIKCDLNKSILNSGFLGAVIVTAVLCFTSELYHDYVTDKSYSVFEALFSLDRSILESDCFCASVFAYQKALTGYITMFIPIITAFPFMVSFCAERNSGLMRMTITRTGKMKYYFSKFFASFLSGGLAVMFGTVLFGILCSFVLPNLSEYNISAEELKMCLPEGTTDVAVRVTIAAFLYGGIATLPAFFICSFCKNPYIITCIPFMLNYVWNTSISKAISKGYETGDYEISQKLNPFMPDSITILAYSGQVKETVVKTMMFNSAYLVILFVLFVLIMNSRTDKGA